MSNVTGIQRLRQAIDNQSAAGEACFSLPMGEARALCDEVEDELARLSWAESAPAPVDADGEVVPLTTKVMYDGYGEEVRIERFELIFGFATVWYAIKMSRDPRRLDDLHLTRPDSWERLEEDVGRMASSDDALRECYYFSKDDTECFECPAKSVVSCGRYIASDVVRRAKALAGRDAKEADRG